MSTDAVNTGYWPLDVPFPACLTDADLMRVLGIGKTLFYELKASCRFDLLLVDGVSDRVTRYDGARVRLWLDGNGKSFLRRGSTSAHQAPRPVRPQAQRRSQPARQALHASSFSREGR